MDSKKNDAELRGRQLAMLHPLAREIPNIDSAIAEIARFSAELTLPKGTIHVISDIHGDDKKLRHVINNASGTLRPLVERLLKDRMPPEQFQEFLTLVFYPGEVVDRLEQTLHTPPEQKHYGTTIFHSALPRKLRDRVLQISTSNTNNDSLNPMIVTTADLYKLAYSRYAIGAYNINNLEQTLGLFRGCIDSRAPFIIQLSKGARKYADKGMLEVMIRRAEEIYPEAVFAVHLDHGDEETCYECINSGFYSSVMIDASHESFDENVAITKRVVERAHQKGISVEAELGRLGGVEEDVQVDEGSAFLTDPKEAVEFVKKTGCDSLAAAIGTSHGAFKFKGKQSLHFEVIREIQERLPGTPIVMHGSSSVPEEEVRRINAAGGKLDPSARGVDEDEYLPAAKLGVTKINIDTDGRLVWTRVHREFFRDHPEMFDFRPPGKTFVAEYAKFIAHKNEKLASAGQLPEVRQALAKKC